MSDTIKLSELLSSAAYACDVRHDACRDAGLKHGARICISQAAALRAIAPALVEALAAVKAYRNDPDSCWTVGAYEQLETAWAEFLEAMKEAGVTCE